MEQKIKFFLLLDFLCMGISQKLQRGEIKLFEFALSGSIAIAQSIEGRVDITVDIFVGLDVCLDLSNAVAGNLKILRDAEVASESNYQYFGFFVVVFLFKCG